MSGNAVEGFIIMTQYLPSLLIHGSCYDKARAQVLYVKCMIAREQTDSSHTQGKPLTCEFVLLCNLERL